MPKTLADPLPQTRAEPSARGHARTAAQSWRAQPIESRVSVLEARWEETVPTLATVADLRGVENRLIIWILGAAFSLLFAVLGIFLSGYNSINERFDSVAAELRAEIRETNARMEARFERVEDRFEKMEVKFDTRFEKVEDRFEKMDAKFDALMAELRSQRSDAR